MTSALRTPPSPSFSADAHSAVPEVEPRLAAGSDRSQPPTLPPAPPSADDEGPQRPPLPRRFSATALARYRSCPRAFYFQFVERLPEPTGDGRRSPALARGSAIHAALERSFALPQAERSLENLHRALRSVWRDHVPPGTFETREAEADAGRDALDLLSRFSERHTIDTRPLAREEWLSVELVNQAGERVNLFMRADRIDGLPTPEAPSEIVVVDYKTGPKPADYDCADLRQEPAAQIAVVAASEAYRLPVGMRLIYLGGDGAEVDWWPEPEDVEDTRQRLARLLARIHQDEEFAPQPSQACRWCSYRLRCPAAGALTVDDLEVPEDLEF